MWRKLQSLAERERELVAGGRWDDLPELQAERQQLIDALPSPPPPAAEPLLQAALAQSRATQRELREALQRTEEQLGALRRGRRVVGAYGGAGGTALDRRA